MQQKHSTNSNRHRSALNAQSEKKKKSKSCTAILRLSHAHGSAAFSLFFFLLFLCCNQNRLSCLFNFFHIVWLVGMQQLLSLSFSLLIFLRFPLLFLRDQECSGLFIARLWSPLNSSHYTYVSLFFSLSQFTAVRYGRVPKRTRDIVGSTDDTTAVTNGAGLSSNASTIRIVSCTSSTAAAATVTTKSNSSSSAPTANNSAAKLNNSSSSNGGGGNLILVSSPQMCSTTSTPPIEYISSDMIEASHMSNNNNNNNISDDNQELSVYDVILCVAQAHRAHCNFTESAIKALNLNPLNMPNNHHMTSNQTSIISTSNLITSTTTNSNNSTTQDGSMSDDSGVSWHAVSVINFPSLIKIKYVSFQGRHICRRDDRASASLSMATICNSHDSHRTASRWVRKKGEQTFAHARM